MDAANSTQQKKIWRNMKTTNKKGVVDPHCGIP